LNLGSSGRLCPTSKVVSSPRTRHGNLLPCSSSSATVFPSGLTAEQKRDEYSDSSVYKSLESSVPTGSVSPVPCPFRWVPWVQTRKIFLSSHSQALLIILIKTWVLLNHRSPGNRLPVPWDQVCCLPGFWAPDNRTRDFWVPDYQASGFIVRSVRYRYAGYRAS